MSACSWKRPDPRRTEFNGNGCHVPVDCPVGSLSDEGTPKAAPPDPTTAAAVPAFRKARREKSPMSVTFFASPGAATMTQNLTMCPRKLSLIRFDPGSPIRRARIGPQQRTVTHESHLHHGFHR